MLPAGQAVLFMLVAVLLIMADPPLHAEDHGTPAFECVPCGMKFNDRKEWARHEIRAHGAGGCMECGALFANDLEEGAHKILHHGATHCTACGRDFRSNHEAVDHLVSVHRLPNCPVHHRVFANEEEAAAHAARCQAFRAQYEKKKPGQAARR